MDYFLSKCQVCLQDIFSPDDLIAYEIKDKKIQFIVLKEQPWCGVRCICLNCVRILREYDFARKNGSNFNAHVDQVNKAAENLPQWHKDAMKEYEEIVSFYGENNEH